jgi:hypothetical protein
MAVMKTFEKELKASRHPKVRSTFRWTSLLNKLVKARLAENERKKER